MRWCSALVLAMLVAHPVAAEPAPATLARPAVSPLRRAAAISVAVMPGLLTRGIGSWIAHENRAAKKLMAAGIVGLGVAGLGGAFVGGTGGNPYTIIPGVPLLVGGAGMFLQSWVTDIYVAAGGTRLAAAPRAAPPWLVEAGTSWLHDPYRERALLRGAGRVELGRVGLGAGALVDAGGDVKIGEADVRVRLLGAAPTGDVIACGNRLVARVGGRVHRDDADDVTRTTGELEVIGRHDLSSLDRVFGASFVELGAGLGVVRVKYAGDQHELDRLLLARFAWGVYLGDRGEATMFYDHRRDGLVGGYPASRAAGFVGSIGAGADLRVRGPWALRGTLEIGNAWVTTLAVAYRGGAR